MCVVLAVFVEQMGERAGADQRCIAGEDEDVCGRLVIEDGFGHEGGVAGAEAFGLFDEFAVGVLGECVADVLSAVSGDDDAARDACGAAGLDDPADHWAVGDLV